MVRLQSFTGSGVEDKICRGPMMLFDGVTPGALFFPSHHLFASAC